MWCTEEWCSAACFTTWLYLSLPVSLCLAQNWGEVYNYMIFRVSSVHVLGSSFMFIDYRSSFRFHCLAQNRSLHLIQGLVKLPKLTSSKRLENLTRFGLVQLMSRYEQKKTFLDSQQLVFRRHSLPTKYPLAAQTHLRQHLIIIHIKKYLFLHTNMSSKLSLPF